MPRRLPPTRHLAPSVPRKKGGAMPSPRRALPAALAATALLTATVLHAAAPPRPAVPLHQRIDQLVQSRLGPAARVAPPASPAEFLRGVTLARAGTTPTAGEARRFLADPAPEKRARLVDRLLAGPEHARHLANVLDVMLMERRRDRALPRGAGGGGWNEFLRQSVAANKPWDVLAREVLSGDDRGGKEPHRTRFFLLRAAEPHLVTRDVARLFL